MSVRQMQVNRGSTLFYAGLGAAVGASFSVLSIGLLRWLLGAMTAQAPGLPFSLAAGAPIYWYAARAGGFVAYLLLWLGALCGVLLSGKQVKGIYAFGVHEFMPILAMLFAALHSLVLLGDRYINFSLLDIAVPFTAPYRPLWTGLGTVALYLGAALAASFYLRRWINRRTWRLLHYATYLVFGLALAHGIMAGTDSSAPGVRWLYVTTGAALLFATLLRILTVRRSGAAARGVPATNAAKAAAARGAVSAP